MTERILCAAIWYQDLDTAVHTCSNTEHGTVLCGYRHPHIISQLKSAFRKRSVTADVGKYTQGFLTSTNRFVDRTEAAKIAKEANQCNAGITYLYSEDLY